MPLLRIEGPLKDLHRVSGKDSTMVPIASFTRLEASEFASDRFGCASVLRYGESALSEV